MSDPVGASLPGAAHQWHIVALSGGKDSTALALRLAEIEPRQYRYVCTPTGNELPEMMAHWARQCRKAGWSRKIIASYFEPRPSSAELRRVLGEKSARGAFSPPQRNP